MRRVRKTNAINRDSDTKEIWTSIKELGGTMREVAGIDLEIEKLRQTICEIDIVHDASIDKLNKKINILIMKNDALQIEINSLYKSFDDLINNVTRNNLGKI